MTTTKMMTMTTTIMMTMMLLIASNTLVTALPALTVQSSSSSSSIFIDSTDETDSASTHDDASSNDDRSNQTMNNYQHHLLDRHVASSPLSVAAVCRDGIALLSLHYDVDDVILSKSSSSSYSSASLLDPKTGRLTQQLDGANKSCDGGEEVLEIKHDAAPATASTKAVINANNYDVIDDDDEDDETISDTSCEPRHATVFHDLPLAFRGPLRIETIYENNNSRLSSSSTSTTTTTTTTTPPPMSLLTAGWRTDGITLANAGRELMAQEVRVYCPPVLSTSSSSSTLSTVSSDQNAIMRTNKEQKEEEIMDGVSNRNSNDAVEDVFTVIPRLEQHQQHLLRRQRRRTQPTSYHGRRIAEGLSYYLTKCAATQSGGIGGGDSSAADASRPLSCVGLLACGDGSSSIFHDSSTSSSSSSSSSIRSSSSSGTLYLIDSTGSYRVRAHAIGDAVRASKLHRRMMYVDFTTMDCNDGLRVLLRMIAELEGERIGTKETHEEKEKENESMDKRGNVPSMLMNDAPASSSQEDTDPSSDGSRSAAATKRPAFVATINSLTSVQYHQQRQHSPPSRGMTISSKYTAAVELAVLRCGEGRMRRVRLSSL